MENNIFGNAATLQLFIFIVHFFVVFRKKSAQHCASFAQAKASLLFLLLHAFFICYKFLTNMYTWWIKSLRWYGIPTKFSISLNLSNPLWVCLYRCLMVLLVSLGSVRICFCLPFASLLAWYLLIRWLTIWQSIIFLKPSCDPWVMISRLVPCYPEWVACMLHQHFGHWGILLIF